MTEAALAGVLGLLFAAGTFLVLRRDVVRVVWGVVIISQAANVYLVTMGGLEGTAPIVGHGADAAGTTDPLVQALVLTAIVIGFGTTAFALVLTYRVYEEHGTVDVDALVTEAGGGQGGRGSAGGGGSNGVGSGGAASAGGGAAGGGGGATGGGDRPDASGTAGGDADD